MRAVICDRYGSAEILRLEEIERPVPKAPTRTTAPAVR
jgi:hypothetical protein